MADRYRLSLLPWRDLAADGEGDVGWRTTGDRPAFLLQPVAGGHIPSGWCSFETRVIRRGVNYDGRLLWDRGAGFEDAQAVAIPARRSGVVAELVCLPPGVQRLCWQPMCGEGLIEQGPITLTPVGVVVRLWQMLRRIVPSWLRLSPPERQLLGLTWSAVLCAPSAAYRRAGRSLTYAPAMDYRRWVEQFDSPQGAWRMPPKGGGPVVSILLPATADSSAAAAASVASVYRQRSPAWQLCLASSGPPTEALRQMLDEGPARGRVITVDGAAGDDASALLNRALAAAGGDYVLILRPGDQLADYALERVAQALWREPRIDLLYGDHDHIDAQGRRCDPYFKGGWDPDLFYSQDYLGPARVYRAALLRQVGGVRDGFAGCAEYDLTLRLLAAEPELRVCHTPAMLCHRREPTQRDGEAARRALTDHFAHRPEVVVADGELPGSLRVRYAPPQPAPKVTLIVPTRDQCALLRRCIESIVDKTRYPNWEMLVVDNDSREEATHGYFAEIARDPRIRILRYPHPFNYSAINNFAVRQADGVFVGLINNDVEVIEPDWLTELVSQAARPGIGAVGARLLYGNGRVQHAGLVLGVMGVAGHGHKYFPRNASGYHGYTHMVRSVSAVTAACLVVRRAAYEEVGGLDERQLQVAFNDVDFCLKLREAGYRNLWTPYAELYHHESMSRGATDTPAKRRRLRREVECMRRRWGKSLQTDPYYSPFLTLEREDWSLGWLPRVPPPGGAPTPP